MIKKLVSIICFAIRYLHIKEYKIRNSLKECKQIKRHGGTFFKIGRSNNSSYLKRLIHRVIYKLDDK